ncbi:hypothetical protein N312_02489, partial [Balearica regulorum gibbericeps]
KNVLIVCEISIAYVLIVHRFFCNAQCTQIFLQCPMAHCFYGDVIIHIIHFY